MAEIGTAERERLEKKGDTAYETAYPIRDCADLHAAIRAYGRAPEGERARLRRFIARRRRELGCTEPLPATWHAERGGEHVIVRSTGRPPKRDSEPVYKVRPERTRRKRRGDQN